MEWRVINAADYGFVQRRRRTFIFATRDASIKKNLYGSVNAGTVLIGTADKILDFFLRRKRVLVKYTKEEKQKAIDLYIRYCKQATKVIKELGYPNERHTLVSWYRGYEEKGEVKDDGREEKRLSHVYSEDQVHTAVSFYIEHGKSLSKTVEALGYPHGTRTLKGWIEKLAKEELVQRDYGDTRKRYRTEDVAKALCSSQVRGKTSVAEIANIHDVSRGSIYHMKTI